MASECECLAAGVCAKRNNRQMTALHWKKCQAGHGEMLDALYSQVSQRIGTGKPTQTKRPLIKRRLQEPVGTALKNRIQQLLQVKSGKGCGCETLVSEMDRGGLVWCESQREYIVLRLMTNRDMLADAVAGAGAAHAVIGWALHTALAQPVLCAGANWLLDRAMEDVRSQAKPVKTRQPSLRRCAPQRRLPNSPRTIRTWRALTAKQTKLWQNAMAAAKPKPDPFTETPVFHFGAHLWPLPDRWQWHAEKWNQLAEQITGRCIVGVVTDDRSDTVEQVRAVLSDRFEIFSGVNSKNGENPTFERLQTLIPSGHNDVLLYAHGKGVQDHTARSPAVRIWCEIMYETVIFSHQRIIQHMENGYKLVGSFRTFGDVPHKPTYRWHYSGTFWALRAKYLPGRSVRPGYGGVEAWPGYHFPPQDCYCEFMDNLPMGQLYSDQYMLNLTLGMEQWRKQNASRSV